MLLHYLVTLALLVLLLRIYLVMPRETARQKRRRRKGSDTCSLAVFLGSGGHTSEILTLVATLEFSQFTPRKYIISEGDFLSAQKAKTLEQNKAAASQKDKPHYTIISIPRARRVHQSLVTTPASAARSLASCFYHLTAAPVFFSKSNRSLFADVLLLNGPGTCFVLCVAVYINRLLGLPAPTIVYVESFARVRSLSISGRILRPFVDRFVVQWPQLLQSKGRGEYHGWLV